MAIAFDAATDGGRSTAVTSKTVSHTNGSGSDRYLIVAVGWEGDTDDITGVTYGGTAMQRLGVHSGQSMWQYLYGLAAPATGANDIVISAGATDNIICYSASYTGVHQTVPVDQRITQNNSGISSGAWNGATLVTRVTDSWGVLLSTKSAGGTMSAGGGSTERADGDGMGLFDSNAALGAPASESMNSFASDGTQNWSHLMLNLIPSGATLPTGILVHNMTNGDNTDFTHVFPTGMSNTALIVIVGTHQGVITGVTYNGDAMTKLAEGSSSFDEDGSVWILLNPDTGSNTVDISRSGGSWHGAVAISLSNVKQTTTVTTATEGGSEASPDINITPSTNDNLIITGLGAEAYTYTDDPQVGFAHISSASYEAMAGSMYLQGTAAAFNSQTFLASGQRYGLAVVALEPAPSSTAANSTRPAIVTGKDTSNASRGALLTGKEAANATRGAILTGVDTANASRGAITTGKESANDSRGAVLLGTDTTSSSRGAVVTGYETSNSSRGAITTGQDAANSSRSAVMIGTDTANSSRAAVLTGITTADDDRNAVLTGTDAAASSRGAVITGKDTANDSRGAILTGATGANDSRAAIITGQDSANATRGAIITGKDTDASSRGAILTGTATANDSRGALITGKETADDSRGAHLTGKDTANDNRFAKIHGTDQITSEIMATLWGKDTTYSDRGAILTGFATASDSRGAILTGKLDRGRPTVLPGSTGATILVNRQSRTTIPTRTPTIL